MIAVIVETSLRSCVLGVLVWLALALLRPRNPHLHKTVWSIVLLASIAMPFVLAFGIAPSIPAASIALGAESVWILGRGSAALAHAPAHWLQSATALYVLVALALAVRFALGFARVWRIRRNASVLRTPWAQLDDVRISAQLRSPATFGSTILLPAECSGWSARKLAAVMSHERSHVRRKDCYLMWLARLHACLLWINPLAWWLQSRLAALAETTSDDAAVAELGDCSTYAEVLLEIVSSHDGTRVATAAQMAGSPSQIVRRIERILSGITPSAAPKRRYQLLVVTLLLPAVIASAVSLRARAMTLAQADAPSQSAPSDDDPLAPKIVSFDRNLEHYFPPEAKGRGVTGLVKIAIHIDADGQAVGSDILSESPTEFGFAAAAAQLALTFVFTNPRHVPTAVPIMVKFALAPSTTPASSLPPPQSPAGG